jgi:hypothetical protein
MSETSETAIVQLCRRLQIDSGFFEQCLQESVIEIQESDGRLDMGNGTVLRLRQLECICLTLKVDLPIALLLLDLTRQVAALDEEVRLLRAPHHP